MVECSWINFFHFALFAGFVTLSGLALNDVISGDTTINVLKVNQEYISTFPSFSMCTTKLINSTDLQGGIWNETIETVFGVKLDLIASVWTPKMQNINLMDKSKVLEYFDSSWNVQCKPLDDFDVDDKIDRPICMPCLVYKIESLKIKEVERGHVGIQLFPIQQNVRVILTFHDNLQSLTLMQGFDWSHSVYLVFRPEVSLEIANNLQFTEKKRISNCTLGEFDIDKDMMELLSWNINCSVPWSTFKIKELEECKAVKDFDKYLTAIYQLQKDFKNIREKCNVKSWKAFPMFENPYQGNTSILYGIILNKKDGISIENEVKVYTFPYFIGTFGGYLGLFLGGSIFGYLQIISDFFTSRTP